MRKMQRLSNVKLTLFLNNLKIISIILIDLEEQLNKVASQEFQTENEPDKSTNDRVVTSTEFFLNPNLNSSKESAPLCDNQQDFPTFIKHPRVLHKALPKLSRKMESLSDCAQNCKNKMSFDGEELFDCYGFSFLGRQADNKCEFYENHEFVSLFF